MDAELIEKMETVGHIKKRFWQRKGAEELKVEMKTEERADGLYILISGNGDQAEHRLKELRDLYVSESETPKRRPGSEEDYMPILMSIEQTIASHYKAYPGLKDTDVILALERLGLKPEMPISDEKSLLSSLQFNLRMRLSLDSYSRREVRWALRKILGSVRRHHKLDGPRGYLDFIIDYV